MIEQIEISFIHKSAVASQPNEKNTEQTRCIIDMFEHKLEVRRYK